MVEGEFGEVSIDGVVGKSIVRSGGGVGYRSFWMLTLILLATCELG